MVKKGFPSFGITHCGSLVADLKKSEADLKKTRPYIGEEIGDTVKCNEKKINPLKTQATIDKCNINRFFIS